MDFSNPPPHILAKKLELPSFPEFEEVSALASVDVELDTVPTLQSIAHGSLETLQRMITAPDLDPEDEHYQFEKKLKLQAVEVGLRTIGKHEENILRKQKLDVMPKILELIAREEQRLAQLDSGELVLLGHSTDAHQTTSPLLREDA